MMRWSTSLSLRESLKDLFSLSLSSPSPPQSYWLSERQRQRERSRTSTSEGGVSERSEWELVCVV
jgi:hypothetical protein